MARGQGQKKSQSARKNSSVDLTLQIPCATTWQRTYEVKLGFLRFARALFTRRSVCAGE